MLLNEVETADDWALRTVDWLEIVLDSVEEMPDTDEFRNERALDATSDWLAAVDATLEMAAELAEAVALNDETAVDVMADWLLRADDSVVTDDATLEIAEELVEPRIDSEEIADELVEAVSDSDEIADDVTMALALRRDTVALVTELCDESTELRLDTTELRLTAMTPEICELTALRVELVELNELLIALWTDEIVETLEASDEIWLEIDDDSPAVIWAWATPVPSHELIFE